MVKAVGRRAPIRSTAIDTEFREVCSTKLIVTPIVLGGPGKVVQIDEYLFNHKPKCISQTYIIESVSIECSSYHRGKDPANE